MKAKSLLWLACGCVPQILARAASDGDSSWHALTAPLMTRWAAEVGPSNSLPEYPRPQLVRTQWLNLNGLWDYTITADSASKPQRFTGKILVPFPVESALSGVMTNFDEHSQLWYQRSFAAPQSWRGQHVRLHFGAVDWRCQVWVNGRDIGQHQGGYDPFSFDITDALHWNDAEEIVVRVLDPTEGDQPRGKQSRKPEGIFYTSTSGIWQTVWLEPVPPVCVDRLKTIADIDSKSVRLRVAVNSLSDDLRIEAVAYAEGKEAGRVAGAPNTDLILPLSKPRLWSPDDPFLYDLKIILKGKDQSFDSVTSYFGMRKISLRKDEQEFTRVALNDQFLFQIGTLDQGFWPDGIYTAPTDEALRSDIEYLKTSGFNLARKHVKVEPERWYYWCDKLGLLVWQDIPSGNNATADGRRNFENEMFRIVDSLENHPCIVTWVLFNEGWGQYDTKPLAERLRQRDPLRLVDNASGWTDMRAGDLIDMHNYPGPDSPAPEPHRAAVLGEFGGFGLSVPGHSWSSNCWGYKMLTDGRELADRYSQAMTQVRKLAELRGLSAAVYTQNTDVETECNGLRTYDRAVSKIAPDLLLAANRSGISETPEKVILASGLFGRVKWRYTTEPPPDNWMQPDFDASTWKEGVGGFGSTATPGVFLNTSWTTSDIWLRREIDIASEDIARMKLQVFHDEDAEIYLNGALAARLTGFLTEYGLFEISSLAASTLKPGVNTVAVHCHQTSGGQGIDVGILIPRSESRGSK